MTSTSTTATVGSMFPSAGGGNYPNPVYSSSQYSPFGIPSTPTVLNVMNGCDSKINNPGKVGPTLPRRTAPGVDTSKITTNDWCSVLQPVCQMQDPNAPMFATPGNSPTQVPPSDMSGTGQIPYSPQAYCEATCSSLNDAYLIDFQKQCPSNTTAIKDNDSNHNNPRSPGPYIPLYFKNTGCVQNQLICSPNNLTNALGEIVVPSKTTLLPAAPNSNNYTPAQMICNRVPNYIYSTVDGSCVPITANNNKNPSCPPPIASSPNSQNDPTNPANILKSMGMDQVCTQSEQDSNSADSQQITAKIEASAGVFGGGAGASAQTDDAFTEQAAQHSQQTSGCAQRTAQISNTTSNKNSQACSITETSNNSNLTMNDSTTITLTTQPASNASLNIMNNLISACESVNSNTNLGSRMMPWCDSITKLSETIADDSINMNHTNLTNKSNITGSVQATSNVSNIQNTAATFKDSVKQATTQNLQNLIGANALPLNTNQVIDQALTDNQNIINDAITQIQNSSSLSANDGNNVTLNSAGGINMTNVNIDNDLVTNMNATALVTSATQIGQHIASQLVSQQSNTADDKTKVAGQEAIVNALGKANATALAAIPGNNSSSSSTIVIIVIIIICIIVICVGGFFLVKFLKSQPFGDTSSQPVGDTSSQPVGDTSQTVVDSGKSSSFKNRKKRFSNMENPIENTEIDYSFVCTITLSFCIFILFMFLIVKKK